MIFFQIILHPAVLIYDFHIFITSVLNVFAKVYSAQFPSRLFSLYGLFSQSRSCDNTLENCFFQISSYLHAHVRIIYDKKNEQIPLRPTLGKQNNKLRRTIFVHFFAATSNTTFSVTTFCGCRRKTSNHSFTSLHSFHFTVSINSRINSYLILREKRGRKTKNIDNRFHQGHWTERNAELKA